MTRTTRLCWMLAIGSVCWLSLRTPLASLAHAEPVQPVVRKPVPNEAAAHDHVRDLQTEAIRSNTAEWGHWGPIPQRYSVWRSHSNRLIPLYTFGISQAGVSGEKSVYRDAAKIRELYGRLPEDTLNPEAVYSDQTDVYRLQRDAVAAGKKNIILIVFDGMDWQTIWAAATYQAGKVAYREGRGTGLHFQDYRGAPTDFGYFVSSPHNDGTLYDVDAQMLKNPGGRLGGGYDPYLAGDTPWAVPRDPFYPIGQGAPPGRRKHAYTDSSSSASSMTTGKKFYNDGVNIDAQGNQIETIAQQLQKQGFKVGAVTSVPISHATPACTYAHNVSRDDYQDLSRDMLGLVSVSHRREPLPGLDVLIGCGWGEDTRKKDPPVSLPILSQPPIDYDRIDQGMNFVPGNRYLTDSDLAQIDIENGGKYRVVQRTPGQSGNEVLMAGAKQAAAKGERLFGYFGAKKGHLPFRTADGRFDPTISADAVNTRVATATEVYTPEDLTENPTLAEMAQAALTVLSKNEKGFWLLIEAGDVDWANHTNNIDNSIGAVVSGDLAFRAVTDWVETRPEGWRDTAVFLTADHGHYLVLTRPEALVEGKSAK